MRNFYPLAFLCAIKAWFVSDLVGNSEDMFSHIMAHFMFVVRPLILPVIILYFYIFLSFFDSSFFLLPDK